MGYILAEILACLLLAWLLGALLGWWLRGGCKDSSKDNTDDINALKKRYEDELQSKQDFYNTKIKNLEDSYTLKLNQTESKIKNLQSNLKHSENSSDESSEDLKKIHENQLQDKENFYDSKIKSIENSYLLKLNQAEAEKEDLKSEISKLKSLQENKQQLVDRDINHNTPIVNQKDKEKCYELEEIQGIGPGFALRLKKRGILNSCYLANKFLYDEHETNKISKKLEINSNVIKAWASMADLMKIDGISSEYAEILQEIGIDTRFELSKSNANDLHQKIKKYRDKYPNGPKIPDIRDIKRWIENLS